jgi:propanol-preferring alcohol dehydrogenase
MTEEISMRELSTYRAYQVAGQRQFELVDRELVAPSAGHVRFRVQSCGVCHSDVLGVEGMRADPSQPVVPGHEVVGVIDAVGQGVTTWQVGDRVGLGFLGGHCGVCDWCRRGDFVNCENQPQPGTTQDGGYTEVTYARATGLVRIPDALSSLQASPLLRAGITTFNALQNLDVEPGALIGIQGLGGLGHLGVQYANKLGYRVVAIARGAEKALLAKQLGAHHYIDSSAVDRGDERSVPLRGRPEGLRTHDVRAGPLPGRARRCNHLAAGGGATCSPTECQE